MPKMLVLSAAEAEAVRGESSPCHALHPLPLVDGRYVLPLRVLEAPEHESRRAYLTAHGTVEDIGPEMFPTREMRKLSL